MVAAGPVPEVPKVLLAEVLENRKIAPVTWIIKLHAPEIAPHVRAGQFVNLRTTDSIVPLPAPRLPK